MFKFSRTDGRSVGRSVGRSDGRTLAGQSTAIFSKTMIGRTTKLGILVVQRMAYLTIICSVTLTEGHSDSPKMTKMPAESLHRLTFRFTRESNKWQAATSNLDPNPVTLIFLKGSQPQQSSEASCHKAAPRQAW